MKKKIAIFANGWNSENIYNYMIGLNDALPKGKADMFMFLGHGTYSYSLDQRKSECLIYDLPDLKDFDAAIVFGSSLNFAEVIDDIYSKCKEADIPTISIGIEWPNSYYLIADNYAGMQDLCEHLIKEHNVKKVKFIAGAKDNRDSELRLNAVIDTMDKYGLSFSEDDVYYSNWETDSVKKFIDNVYGFDNPNNRPDAIICANDELAIFASLALDKYGLAAPDDVIITGFDYIGLGQLFYPSIASVDHHYRRFGEKTAEVLTDVFTGKDASCANIIPCEFFPGESCGCYNCRKEDDIRRMNARFTPSRKLVQDHLEGRLHAMSDAVLTSDQFSNLPDVLQNLFLTTNGREGDSFYIVMDPAFANLAYEEIDSLPMHRIAPRMKVIVAKEDGIKVDIDESDIKELIPGYKGEGSNHMYVFMPIYLHNFSCGYMVMRDHYEYIHEMTFRDFNHYFNLALESYSKNLRLHALNLKLQDIMQKDALTTVSNRIAYKNYVDRLEENFKNGERNPFAVAMFDVNDLKLINDSLGHEAGDEYIKNSCKYICEYFKHSPVFRIGGDEFVVIVSNSDYDMRTELLKNFENGLVKIASEDRPQTEKVSIAVGMADFDVVLDSGFSSIFHRADELMYINKKEKKKGKIR